MAPSLQVEANLPKPRRAYRGRCCPFSPSHRPFALDANLQSAYLTKTIGDAASIKGADFSEAVMPTFTQKMLCGRADAIGENTKTGVATRDSLMCP